MASLLEKTWEKIQIKTFTKWVNSHLAKRGMKIDDIQKDFEDGVKLINLLEIIGAEPAAKYYKKTKMRIQNVENVNVALRYLTDRGVKLASISGENIVDGDLKLILGTIWTIILRFQIADISEEELSARDALLLWCKKKTAPYNNVKVENFTYSWQDGLAFCALIHAHRPDLIDYHSLSAEDKKGNLELAFAVAEEKLGIPRLLDSEDVYDVPKPDERSIITYVSQYYHCFAAGQKAEIAGRRIGKLVDLTVTNDQLKADYAAKARSHVEAVNGQIKKLEVRDFDNSLEGAKHQLAAYQSYRRDVRPPLVAERLYVDQLLATIQMKLKSDDRPPYVPPEDASPARIEQVWKHLEKAETDRDADIRAELARQERLALLDRRFGNNYSKLDNWISTKEDYLNREEHIDSISSAQSAIADLDAFEGEYEASKTKVDTVNQLAREITDLNGSTKDDVNRKSQEITDRWNQLRGAADRKRAKLADQLKNEEEKEGLRKKWAHESKEYKAWVKDSISQVNDAYFGNNLENVRAFHDNLEKNSKQLSENNDSKKDNLDNLWGNLQDKNVHDNPYTAMTDKDVAALHKQLQDALSRRNAAYTDEANRFEELDAKCREFAAATGKFIEFVDERRKGINALQGEPEPLSQKITEVYDNGRPEKEKLQEIVALREEMGRLGINDTSAHTPHTIQSLQAYADAFDRDVKKKIHLLAEEAELKNSYNKRAQELIQWIKSTEPRLADRSWDNTLEGIIHKRSEWHSYRTSERAEKAVEKEEVLYLHTKIEAFLSSHNRPSFETAPGATPRDINSAWEVMVGHEKEYDHAINKEVSHQERLYRVARQFNGECDDLETWAQEKESYLNEDEDIHTLDEARMHLLRLDVYTEEYSASLPRINQIQEWKQDLASHNYCKSAEITGRAEKLQSKWNRLQLLEAAKRKRLTAALQEQQRREGLRLDFANQAKDYTSWVRHTVDDLNNFFGLTLQEVVDYKSKLDNSNKELRSSNNSKRDGCQNAADQLAANKITDNRHTDLTIDDVNAAHNDLENALNARNEAYDKELARQQKDDALRKEFAKKANDFVHFLDDQRKKLHDVDGLPNEKSAAVKKIHNDGSEAEAKLNDIRNLNHEMTGRSIYTNPYTDHTLHSLEQKNKQHNDAVGIMLATFAEEDEMLRRREAQAAETEARHQLENSRVDWDKRAAALLAWLESVFDIFNDPLAVSSVQEVQDLIKVFQGAKSDLHKKEADYNALVKDEAAITAKGATVKLAPVTARWEATNADCARREKELDDELHRQQSNETLCREFADKANALQSWISTQTHALANPKGSSLEDQLAEANQIGAELHHGREQLDVLNALSDKLQAARISRNPFTQLDVAALKVQVDELERAVAEKQKVLDKQITLKKHSQATPEQIEEFKEVFQHFDKGKKGNLSRLDFKACLQSLGEDPTEARMDSLMQELADGEGEPATRTISFDRFVGYMIKISSDNITKEQIRSSFKDLADGKDFITEADLRRVLPAEKVEYLIKNMPKYQTEADIGLAFDYNQWADQAFSR